MWEVYSENVVRRYYARTLSIGFALSIIYRGLMVVLPFVAAYAMQGFWISEATYVEQPDIHFKHSLIAVLDGSNPFTSLVWSTFPDVNRLSQASLRVPVVQSYETDGNQDGVNDQLKITLSFPLNDDETVTGVKLLLFFDYRLSRKLRLVMESMAYLEYSAGVGGSQLFADGYLVLRQLSPIPYRSTRVVYNGTLVARPDITLPEIFAAYADRNETTEYQPPYKVWTAGRASGQPFVITATVRYPQQTVVYKPGFWMIIKFAWIQYLCIAAIFYAVFRYMRKYIYGSQMVPTFISPDKHSINPRPHIS